MGACSAIHSLRWSAPFASWNSPWRKKKGNSRMSHRAGLDRSTVVEAAAKLVDEEGIEQLTLGRLAERLGVRTPSLYNRSEEHTSELQSHSDLVCRLLLEKKKNKKGDKKYWK